MRHIPSYFLWLGRAALVAYFLLAALILAGRYWVLPNIDQWRPLIQQQLSAALGSQVELGQVNANWSGLDPTFSLGNIVIKNAAGQVVFSLPHVGARLKWASLLQGQVRFKSLTAAGLELDVRRDGDGSLWLMGQPLETSQDASSSSSHPLAAWLLQQDHILLDNASLRWRDEMRDAPALALENIDLQFVREREGYAARLTLNAPAALAGELELSARVQYSDTRLELTDPHAWSGLIYLSMADVRPQAWVSWIDFPQYLVQGEMSGKWWVAIHAGKAPVVTANVSVSNGHFEFDTEQKTRAHVEQAHIDASGSWPAFKTTFEALGTPQQRPVPVSTDEAVQWRFRASNFHLTAPDVFEKPLAFDRLDLDLASRRDAQERLRVDLLQAQVTSPALDIVMQGQWQEGAPGSSGTADFHGRLNRLRLGQIGAHLPATVDADAREWLGRGLPKGELRDATVRLAGALDDFPFGDDPAKGQFRIAGRFDGTEIDYAPPVPEGELTWPKLTDISGVVALDRVDLRLFADQAVMTPEPGRPINLKSVKARIPNIETNAVLIIQGDSSAPAQAYLGLARTTPLGELLDNALSQASADGEWVVPLKLRVPLFDTDAATVQGEIRFAGGKVMLDPEVPPLENVQGLLNFSDLGLDSDDLTASFLGGPLSLKGGIGGGNKGLVLQGQLNSEALARFVNLRGMKRLTGKLNYQGLVQRLPTRRYAMSLQSDLTGLKADFPQPVGKEASQSLPLRIDWTPGTDAKTARMDISLGSDVRLRLQRRADTVSTAWFDAVAVGVRQAPLVPARGLAIDARYPEIDADIWREITAEFDAPLDASARRNSSASTPLKGGEKLPLLPSLRQLRVQADSLLVYGLHLTEATLTLAQPVSGQWRVDVNSMQTAGVLRWDEARAGQAEFIEGQFERLMLGSADQDKKPDETGSSATDSRHGDAATLKDFDIPALKIDAQQFTLYGRPLGQLSVKGINVAKGKEWKLENLSIKNESAQLVGTGQWLLDGQGRGLTLNANVAISNFGGMLDRLGHKGAMVGGVGEIKGQLRWGNMPWQFERADISGKLDIDLKKGRFSSLNSRSAKVLELLSFQSMQRILTFDVRPDSLFREGYPFDELSGNLIIDKGIMSANSFEVDGPVGKISLGGDVNLVDETLRMQAMVVPNLDMSGAALAGIAINPIVGVGAFLTQWLLKAPLSRAMTLHYQVSGKLDDPKLKEVSRNENRDDRQNAEDQKKAD